MWHASWPAAAFTAQAHCVTLLTVITLVSFPSTPFSSHLDLNQTSVFSCVPPLPLTTLQAFAEVLANNESWSAPMDETYELLGVDPASITGLEQYLQVGQWAAGWGVG
jgi:hypothetical protein